MKGSYLWGLAGLVLSLAGCTGNGTTGAFNQPGPRIRAVNALDGVVTADWQVSGQTNVSFPAVAFGQLSNAYASPYVVLNERGSQNLTFFNSTNPTVALTTFNGHDYTYGDKNTAIGYGGGTGGSASIVFLYDQATNSTSGPNVRCVNAAQEQGNVDVFITPSGQAQSGAPITLAPGGVYPNQTAGTYAYSSLPTLTASNGNYNVSFYPAGHDTTALVTYPLSLQTNGDVWTLVLLDNSSGSGAPTVLAIHDNNPNAG